MDTIQFDNCFDLPVGTKVRHRGTGDEGITIQPLDDNHQPAPDMHLVMWDDVVLWERTLTLQVTEWAS